MAAASWICLLLPLASAVAITARRHCDPAPRRRLRLDGVTTMGAFVAAIVAFADMAGKSASHRGAATTSWTWL